MRREGVSAIQGHSPAMVVLKVCGPFHSNYPAFVHSRWETKNGSRADVLVKLIIT